MKKLNISFEGASGIGKTTLCERFKNTYFLSEFEIHSFYEHKINNGEIFFPDIYIVFHIHETKLRERKEAD